MHEYHTRRLMSSHFTFKRSCVSNARKIQVCKLDLARDVKKNVFMNASNYKDQRQTSFPKRRMKETKTCSHFLSHVQTQRHFLFIVKSGLWESYND